MDAEERELLSLQTQFLASKDPPAASVSQQPHAYSQGEFHEEPSVREAIPGERVLLDLDSDYASESSTNKKTFATNAVISDIVEREPASITETSFEAPQHGLPPRPKKIDWRAKGKRTSGQMSGQSRFAASRRTPVSEAESASDEHVLKAQIDSENNQKLEGMTEGEIIAERTELTASLDSGVVAALMRRRRKAVSTPVPTDPLDVGPQFTSQQISAVPKVTKSSDVQDRDSVIDSDNDTRLAERIAKEDAVEYTTAAEALQDEDGEETHTHTEACFQTDDGEAMSSVHFPSGLHAHDLDPYSESFLTDLKSKYYPTLDHDPSALSWMQPPTEAEDMSEYHESQDFLLPAQLRFDFQGNFVAPRTSREIQKDIGLHHHADAPLAAGYTVPELVHLCRSAYPAQACLAIQTIGRVGYKIGKEFYGESISAKLKSLVEKSCVERSLLDRARDRHQGVSSYATEALWQINLGRQGAVVEGQ